MKAIIATAATAVALIATTASAQDANWYVRGDAGGSFDSKISGANGPRSDGGWAIDAGVGREFSHGFRGEGEILYLDNNGKRGSADTKTVAAFANAYYDFNRDGAWRPFVGVGIGVGNVKVDGANAVVRDDHTGFAYQAKVGLAHPFNDRLTGELAYRYMGVTDVKIGSGANRIDGHYGASLVSVGFRYKFGR